MKIANRRTGETIWENQELAHLSDADLRGANLRYADLCGANLRYADLSGANLRAKQYVIRIHGRRHAITAIDDDVRIGCIQHTLAQWLVDFAAIGKEQGYLAEEIEEYGMHLRHIAAVLAMRAAISE